MLPEESGTLPHRPWTPMSLVNGRSPQAKRCGRDGAKRKSVRKRLPLRWSRCVEILRGSRHNPPAANTSRRDAPDPREGTTAQGDPTEHREATPQRKARHHRGVTAGRETARLHREATPQRKARHHREATAATEGAMQHRYEQPAEPAASGRALFVK